MALGFAASRAFSDDNAASNWTAPTRATRKTNPIPANEASVAAGKAVYMKNCMSCHGATGKGDGVAAVALETKPRDLSDPKIAAQSDGSMF
jgi:mono/diheme cytochrome c family protein